MASFIEAEGIVKTPLTDAGKDVFSNVLHSSTVYRTLISLNEISEVCFSKCVQSFEKAKLENSEESCFRNCLTKNFIYQQRMSRNGMEYFAKETQSVIAPLWPELAEQLKPPSPP